MTVGRRKVQAVDFVCFGLLCASGLFQVEDPRSLLPVGQLPITRIDACCLETM
jgi:hypothetical protein